MKKKRTKIFFFYAINHVLMDKSTMIQNKTVIIRASISSFREFDSLQVGIYHKNFQFNLVVRKLSIMNEVYEISELIVNREF